MKSLLTGFWSEAEFSPVEYNIPEYAEQHHDKKYYLDVDGTKYYIPELACYTRTILLDDIVINVDGVRYVLWIEDNKFDRLAAQTLINFRQTMIDNITNKQSMLKYFKERGYIV